MDSLDLDLNVVTKIMLIETFGHGHLDLIRHLIESDIAIMREWSFIGSKIPDGIAVCITTMFSQCREFLGKGHLEMVKYLTESPRVHDGITLGIATMFSQCIQFRGI
jgi:hypothetical protein